MLSSRKLMRGAVAAVVLSTIVAGCSSKGGAQTTSAGGANGKSYTIAMVTHEQAGDTFWDKIRAGAQQAAKDHNITLKYSNDDQAPNQATLVKNAIDSKVDGLAVTLAYPDAVGPEVQAAVRAGIPAVAFNSGIDQYKQYGALMYFGSDETLAGRTAGKRIAAEDNDGKTLCIIQIQGEVALEDRCAGVKATDPNTENLQVNGADLPSVQQTIQTKLQQDPTITHVVTLGAPIALAARQGKSQANSKAKIVTFDLNTDVAKDIQNGSIEFSIDQQPYVQGYMAVTSLWLYLTNGNDMGGGGPVLTGPSIVDSADIAKIVPYAENNTR